MVLQPVNSELEMLNLVKRCRFKWELTERESYSKEKGDDEKNRSVLLFKYVHFSATKRKVWFVKASHLRAIATIITSINGISTLLEADMHTGVCPCIQVHDFCPHFQKRFILRFLSFFKNPTAVLNCCVWTASEECQTDRRDILHIRTIH